MQDAAQLMIQLRIACTGFGKAVLSINGSLVDLYEMAIDLHFFFKHSAGRREEFKKSDAITGITVHHLDKHCESP